MFIKYKYRWLHREVFIDMPVYTGHYICIHFLPLSAAGT